jgi:hypothetical protein
MELPLLPVPALEDDLGWAEQAAQRIRLAEGQNWKGVFRAADYFTGAGSSEVSHERQLAVGIQMTQAKASAEIPWSRPTVPQQPRTPWELFLSEMIGTGLLPLGGLSLVIFIFGAGSPIAELLPSRTIRMVISGFLFGSIGALIAVSPVGDVSGAHINPAVSLGFLLMGKFKPRVAFGYVVAQLTGSLLGCLPLLVWGKMGRSIDFGASLPGQGYSSWTAGTARPCRSTTRRTCLIRWRVQNCGPDWYWCQIYSPPEAP